jgi:L-lactate dehydrogenase complex protein LldG
MGKESILEKIRRGKPEAKAHPGKMKVEVSKNIEQLAEEFRQNALSVGAEVTESTDKTNIEHILSEQYPAAVDFRKKENREKYGADSPKEKLEMLKSIILKGRFGVAENGAIWMDDSGFPNRLIPFITEHLIILVPKNNLVSTMHEAYEIISKTEYNFGVFISGPSKTADIEQSLVYGAHGAKSLNIIID